MFVKLCQHWKEDGKLCRSPALRGQSYCHFHLRYKGYPLRTWPTVRPLGSLRFTRKMAFNLRSLQNALKRVEMALATGTCRDRKVANLIRYGLQTAISDLRYGQSQGNAATEDFSGRQPRGEEVKPSE